MNNVWWFPWMTLLCWALAVGAPARQAWRDGDRPAVIGLVALCAIGGPAMIFAVAPALPAAAITPMHEGFTEAALAHAGGFQLSEDLSIMNLRRWLDKGFAPPFGLRAMVGVELALQLGAGAVWWMAAHRGRLPPTLAACLGVVWWLPPLGWHMPLGVSGSSHLLWLGGLVAWMAVESERSPGFARRGAWWTAIPVAALLLGVRRDAALWGIGLVAVVTLSSWGPWARVDRAVAAWFRRGAPQRALGVAAAGYGVLAAVSLRVSASYPPQLGSPAWTLYVLQPPNLPGLSLIPALIAGLSPVIAGLVIAGAWRARARPTAWLALPLVAAWAWQTHLYAAHATPPGTGPSVATFEAWRYFMVLSPLVAGLALLGADGLRHRWRPWMVALLALPPVPEALAALSPIWPVSQARWPRVFGLDTDLHRETRALLALHEAPWPEARCWILSRSLDWQVPDDPYARIWVMTAFKKPLPTRVYLDLPPQTPPAEALAHGIERMPWLRGATPPCVIAWWSGDCRGTDDPGCAAIAALPERPPRVTLDGTPFVHPAHGPIVHEPAEIGAHRLDVRVE